MNLCGAKSAVPKQRKKTMKKLMIMLGVAVTAVCVNAASINWTISNVYSVGDATTKADGYMAYLFVTANSSNVDGITLTTLDAVSTALAAGKMSDVVALSSAHQELASGGFASKPTGISSDFSSGSLSAFAVVFDAADAASASHYYIVNEGATKSVSFTSATGAKNLAFGTQATATQNAANWAAVPEPTSGLLMLLGMAGLALRRRRA